MPRTNSQVVRRQFDQAVSPQFAQQGQVDWVAVGNTVVHHSINTLAQLSKAGVEVLTMDTALVMFSQLRITPSGQIRIQDELDKLMAFSSVSDALYFGFGIKHFLRRMSETEQGLSCVAVCAALTEQYSVRMSARIVRELFLTYSPPETFTPALRQWIALVQGCAGALGTSSFGLMLHQIAKMYLSSSSPNFQCFPDPKLIAGTIRALFEVSLGHLDHITVSGGADCAWIITLAHWVVDLSTELLDTEGNVVYSPGVRHGRSRDQVQVTVILGPSEASTRTEIVQRAYVIPSGEKLVSVFHQDEFNTNGRVSWESRLSSVFGERALSLLNAKGSILGTCLGSAARIFEGILSETDSLPQKVRHAFRLWWHFTDSSCYGKGFVEAVRRLLPEIGTNEMACKFMVDSNTKDCPKAIAEYASSMQCMRCPCELCKSEPQTGIRRQIYSGSYCQILITETIINLVLLMSNTTFHDGLEVLPTRGGIEFLYGDRAFRSPRLTERHYDHVSKSLVGLFPQLPILSVYRGLFTGRTEEGRKWNNDQSAAAADGFCYVQDTLMKISTSPTRMSRVHVFPGQIQWKDHIYHSVQDQHTPVESPIRQDRNTTNLVGIASL